MAFGLREAGFSAPQKSILRKALAQLGTEGLDWQSAVSRELGIFYGPLHTPEGMRELDSQASDALAEIVPSYVSTLNDPSMLPRLRKMIADAPRPLPQIIPSPQRVLEEKQDLAGRLLQMRSLLQGCGRPASLPVCATCVQAHSVKNEPAPAWGRDGLR